MTIILHVQKHYPQIKEKNYKSTNKKLDVKT